MAQELEGPVTIKGGLSVEKSILSVDDSQGNLLVIDGNVMVFKTNKFFEQSVVIGDNGNILATGEIEAGKKLRSAQLIVDEVFSRTSAPIAVHGGLDIKGEGSDPGNVKVDANIFSSGTIEAAKNLKSAQLNVGELLSVTSGPIVVRAGLEVRGEGNELDVNVVRGNVKALNVFVEGNLQAPFGIVKGAGLECETVHASKTVTARDVNVTGDIRLANADCAEEFEVDHHCDQHIAPGTVVVLGDEGRLRPSSSAYDKRVAGVVSGGGDYKPGIILGNGTAKADGIAVALLGRVSCHVDATHESVEVGDLLTTSDTPGYAMKASDSSRAFGAVIGKALRPLREGKGLVPILVALQ